MAELSITCPNGNSGNAGISLEDHELIDSLVHNLSEDTAQQVVRDGEGRVTNFNVVTDPGGIAVRSTTITRDASGQVVEVLEEQHDEAGAVIQTLTTTINRSGGQVVSVQTEEVGP